MPPGRLPGDEPRPLDARGAATGADGGCDFDVAIRLSIFDYWILAGMPSASESLAGAATGTSRSFLGMVKPKRKSLVSDKFPLCKPRKCRKFFACNQWLRCSPCIRQKWGFETLFLAQKAKVRRK